MTWTLVTGGAQGLGAEICKKLSAQGHNIVVQYHKSLKNAEEVVTACRNNGVEAEMLHGDFSTIQSTQQFAKAFCEQFSAQNLVNNVGEYLLKPLLETTPEEWLHLMQVNVIAPLMITKSLLPSIIASQGSIINIGVSGLGNMRSNIANTAYGMTKLHLWTMTKAWAREFAAENVRVNMVSPGILDNSIDRPQDISKLPMGRLGTTLEVAQTVAFLLDDKNGYITGQNIEVAGALGL